MTACFVFTPSRGELAMVLCAGYLMFYLGQMQLTWLSGMARLPDISYGVYLYGWPVESLWIWFSVDDPGLPFLVPLLFVLDLDG